MIRLFDIIFSISAIIILLPLYILIAILLFIMQGYPIFFTQIRVGRNQKEFKILKFRTMNITTLRPNGNSIRTIKDDPRITPVGSFLRKTSLDEIPQFFNVLKGNMSLVGPRPDTPFQKNDYPIEVWIKRCSVKPGLTGYSQIYGRSSLNIESRIEFDLKWTNEISLVNYFKVLLITPFLMFNDSY